jgi:hypothetical protein
MDDRLDLDLDGIRVELLWVGPAHTAGDVIAGCRRSGSSSPATCLFRLCTPIGWDGTFDGWIGALDRIVALDRRSSCRDTGRSAASKGRARCASTWPTSAPSAASCVRRGRPVVEAREADRPGPVRGVDGARADRLPGGARPTASSRASPTTRPLDVNVLFAGMYEVRQAIDARTAH